ncbi:hypothetical protein Q5P01_013947 [Channa striata]|uniref:Uncharacterized protein n=1 Tax=Channa striata TaxID=64152 RepID=A0AA88SIB7_CHASR|nr:hypothetical protein Q5P01_013947 [Channa striata]
MTVELNRLQSLSKQNSDSLAAELSAVKANLTERLKARDRQISSMSAERDQLNARLNAKTSELNRLQTLSKQSTGGTISLIMEVETHSGVKRTVYMSEVEKTPFGMIGHVQRLCIGSVKKYHKTSV